MRGLPKTVWLALPGWILAAGSAGAQSSAYTPLSAPSGYEAPRELPPEAQVEARPIGPSSVYSPPHSAAPHVPVRLAAAEELASEPSNAGPLTVERTPLPLAPPRAGSTRKLDRPAPPTTGGTIGTVVGSLGIVLGLFLVLAWCSRRFAPAGSGQLPKEAVEMLGRSQLGSKQQVQLIRVGNKLLLVALTAASAQTLTEITDPVEVERLAALCRRGQSASSSASFNQILGQLASEPATGGFVGPPASSNNPARRAPARGAT